MGNLSKTININNLFRTHLGFDTMLSSLANAQPANHQYPPYNIVASEDGTKYGIEIAAAGYTKDDISLTVHNNKLYIKGNKSATEYSQGVVLKHRGISNRNWKLEFDMHEHVNVVDASMSDGMLHVSLEYDVPEESKPQSITIK